MTTEEKLKHFQEICMTDAREKSAKILDDYAKTLDKAYEEHTEDARKRAKMQEEAETEKLGRERNKKLSIGQLDLRREVSRRQEELKDKLFVEVRDKLANFMETREYLDLLEKQIGAAKKVAGDEAMIVYMDPSDEDKARRLAMHHNVTVKISEYSFDGGIRAVIPSKHILIDSSFKTKLEEARHEFKFDLGGKQLMAKTGVIYGINGPVVSLAGDPGFQMNEMVYVGKENLVGEVIGLTSEKTTIQVYEETSGLKPGEVVTGTGAPVSVTLAPGILDNIFDGIERPLSKIAERSGYYIGLSLIHISEPTRH